MMRTVCYFLTRNIYRNVLPSLKSLLKNGNVDRVWLMIEDDDIGFDLPDKVVTMNITRWRDALLDPAGPNYGRRWTYMALMKVALSKINLYWTYDRALTLDADTIVTGDISGIWDIDISDCYLAAAREWYWSRIYNRDCINGGVIMWNLKKMRDGMDDRLIDILNKKAFKFCDQDAISELCEGRIRIMDSAYNFTKWTDPPMTEPKIIHFAAYKEKFFEQEIVKQYQAMDWEEVFGNG